MEFCLEKFIVFYFITSIQNWQCVFIKELEFFPSELLWNVCSCLVCSFSFFFWECLVRKCVTWFSGGVRPITFILRSVRVIKWIWNFIGRTSTPIYHNGVQSKIIVTMLQYTFFERLYSIILFYTLANFLARSCAFFNPSTYIILYLTLFSVRVSLEISFIFLLKTHI